MSPKNDSVITLREITQETLRPILKLEVDDDQNQFVAPNAVSIAEAHFSDYAWFRAIYADETPVGFVMVSIDEEKPEYYLWRFMIDKNHQGKGYGHQAMELVIAYIRTLPNATEMFTSYVPGKGNPGPFYRSLGFIETGEIDDDENVMRLDLEGDA